MNYIIVYSDELNHYGVKGMKWGVRKAEKYAQKEQKWAKKESKARTRFGKNYATYNKLQNRVYKENQIAANKSRTLKEKLQNQYGMEATARANKASADYYDALASRSKSKRAKTKYSSMAYNQRQFAKVHTSLSNKTKSTITRAFSKNGQLMSTKLKTAKGKDTTYAKEFVKAVAVSVAANTAIQVASEYALQKQRW